MSEAPRLEDDPWVALVADDEPDIRELLATLLRRDGFTVVTAGNGEEALRLARERPPDVAVLDVAMPELDSYATARALRAHPDTADTKIVILTASVNDGEHAKALSAGADVYMRKPFRGRELARRIDALLGDRDDDG